MSAAAARTPKAGQIFFAFCAVAGTVTAVNMRSSLADIEDARTRWAAQKARNDALITAYGAQHMSPAAAVEEQK